MGESPAIGGSVGLQYLQCEKFWSLAHRLVFVQSQILAALRCKPAQAERKTTGRPSTCEIGSSNQDAASSKHLPIPLPLPPSPPLIRPTPSARSGGDAASKLRQWSVLTNPPLESSMVGTCGWSVSTQINGVRDRRRGRRRRKTQQPSRKCQAGGP